MAGDYWSLQLTPPLLLMQTSRGMAPCGTSCIAVIRLRLPPSSQATTMLHTYINAFGGGWVPLFSCHGWGTGWEGAPEKGPMQPRMDPIFATPSDQSR